MSQSLYRKWRPIHWDQVIGQEHVVQTLKNAVTTNRVVHAYLFSGPRGTGKTTSARILAKAVNCLENELTKRPCNQCAHCEAVNQGRFLDLIEIDAASNTSVDDVRDLRDKINFSPNQGRYKVYIIDEVHMLSTAAFNALLKTLEEPPQHAIFILATTEVHKIPATVLSRCQRHEFRRIPVKEIIDSLKSLAVEENIQVDAEALNLVARQATGSMRDAISLLDQLASAGTTINLTLAQDVLGTATNQAVIDVVEAMVKRQSNQGLEVIHRSLDSGSDPRQFARQIVDYLRSLLLVAMGNASQVDATPEVRTHMARHSQAFSITELLRVIQAFNQAATETRSSWQPALPLEMAFIQSIMAAAASVSGESTSGKPDSTSETVKVNSSVSKPAGPKTSPGISKPGASEISPEDASANQRLSSRWDQVLARVKTQNPKLAGVMNSARVRVLKGNMLTLGFNGDFYLTTMENPASTELIRNVLKQVMDMDIDVQAVLVTGKTNTPPTDVESDGLVASALHLGGEIVDIQ
jgi:DNA polymerase-3 subunit gamma/tau